MAPFETSVRRLLIAGGFAIAVAAAPTIAAVAVPSGPATQACSSGEEEDVFTGMCVPHTVPNSPTIPAGAVAGVDGLPSVDGIPCTGRNTGECIGLAQDQASEGPAAVPRSSVDGQPLG